MPGTASAPTPPAQVHAGPSIPLLRGFGAEPGRASLTPGSLVPVHLQQMHSRHTARSSKSTRAPPRPVRAPSPAGSAEPVRSASPARCRAWQRATRHPASPKVSTAVPEPVLPVPSRLSQQGPVCLSRGSRQCLDPDGEGNYWHLVGRQQGCCSMPRTPPLWSDLAPDVHRGVWREGALEGVAPRAWVAGVLALGTGRLLPEGESWGPVSGQVSGAGQAGGVAERAREVRPPCGRRPLLLPQGAEDPWLLPSQKAPCSW